MGSSIVASFVVAVDTREIERRNNEKIEALNIEI
jgi:hypothetical protein